MKKLLYEDMVPSEFAQSIAQSQIAYLPLGTIEVHGPHLPLGTDFLAPQALFAKVAAEVGGVVLPPLFVGPDCMEQGEDGLDYYGMDFFCKDYPRQQLTGSAYWIPDELFKKLLSAIMKQLARAGFRIVVGEGHAPSANMFFSMTDAIRANHGIECLRGWDWQQPDDLKIGGHAAVGETSLIMACRPELVQLDKLPSQIGAICPGAPIDPRPIASPEHGRRMLEAHAANLISRIQAVQAKE